MDTAVSSLPTLKMVVVEDDAVVRLFLKETLEKQFGQIPGLTQMTSISSFGSSLVTLQFNLNLSIDIAEQEVQAAINAASSFLPRDLPNPPIYSKTNPADAPILTLAMTSDSLPLINLEELAETLARLRGLQCGVAYAEGFQPALLWGRRRTEPLFP